MRDSKPLMSKAVAVGLRSAACDAKSVVYVDIVGMHSRICTHVYSYVYLYMYICII